MKIKTPRCSLHRGVFVQHCLAILRPVSILYYNRPSINRLWANTTIKWQQVFALKILPIRIASSDRPPGEHKILGSQFRILKKSKSAQRNSNRKQKKVWRKNWVWKSRDTISLSRSVSQAPQHQPITVGIIALILMTVHPGYRNDGTRWFTMHS